jgi:hypothetical protein
MTARTCSRAPVSVVVSKKSAARMAWAWDRRNVAHVLLVRWGAGVPGCRVDPGLVEDVPHGRGGDLDTEDEEFAVDSAVSPGAVLAGQAQHQSAD